MKEMTRRESLLRKAFLSRFKQVTVDVMSPFLDANFDSHEDFNETRDTRINSIMNMEGDFEHKLSLTWFAAESSAMREFCIYAQLAASQWNEECDNQEMPNLKYEVTVKIINTNNSEFKIINQK